MTGNYQFPRYIREVSKQLLRRAIITCTICGWWLKIPQKDRICSFCNLQEVQGTNFTVRLYVHIPRLSTSIRHKLTNTVNRLPSSSKFLHLPLKQQFLCLVYAKDTSSIIQGHLVNSLVKYYHFTEHHSCKTIQ